MTVADLAIVTELVFAGHAVGAAGTLRHDRADRVHRRGRAADPPSADTAGEPLGLFTRFAALPAACGALPVLRAVTDPQAQGGGCYGPGGLGAGRGSPRKVPYAKTAHHEQLAGRL